MTGYNTNDMDGWEFKIMRSALGKFSSYEAVQRVCETEARAGWELVEKFDEHRLRFKRRTDRRAGDSSLQQDPYRTGLGMASGGKAAVVIGLVLLIVGAVLFTIMLSVR